MASFTAVLFFVAVASAAVLARQRQGQSGSGHFTIPTTDIPDFSETKNGFEFIFHDTRNLIMVVNDTNCFFAPVEDKYEGLLDDQRHFFGSSRGWVEFMLLRQISMNSINATTLDAMRVKYQDILADFHCTGKACYEIVFNHYHYSPGSSD